MLHFDWINCLPSGTWIFSSCKTLVCMPGFPVDIFLPLKIFSNHFPLTVRFELRMSHHSFLTKKSSMKTMDMYMATMMRTTSIPLSMAIMLTLTTLQFRNANLKECQEITPTNCCQLLSSRGQIVLYGGIEVKISARVILSVGSRS